MSFFKQTLKGLGWLGGLQAFGRGLALLRTAILARILLPDQFGVFGIVTLVLNLFEILTETGINTVIIQEKKRLKTFIDTAWVVSIFRGILIAFLIILASLPLARFFNLPNVAKLLFFTSLIPLTRGFINPAVIQFRKNLEFKKEFYFRGAIYLAESIVVIIGVLLTRSIASLIFALLFASGLEVFFSFIFCRPRPRFVWEKEKAKRIISQGKWITLTGIFSYFVTEGDDAVVGKILGVEALGFYRLAYKVSNLPFTEVTDVVSRVTFPVYARIAGKKEQVKRAFKKSLLGIIFLVIPATAMIFFFPNLIIKIILGERWLSVAPTLKILAIFGLTRALGGAATPIFYTFKKQDLVAKITFLKFILLFVFIAPLVFKFGISGAALAVLISSLLIQPLIWFQVIKILK